MLVERSRSKMAYLVIVLSISYIALLWISTLILPAVYQSINQSINHRSLYQSINQPVKSTNRLYEGPKWRSEQTVGAVELLSNSWLRLESHTVRLENQSINQSINQSMPDRLIDDWLWIDLVDHVNVLMHSKSNNKFGVFRQRKYGITGDTLAVIGGHINQSINQSMSQSSDQPINQSNDQSIIQELPLDCAKREMYEELHYMSDNWIELGTYRVNANRGEGMFSMFLALNSYQSINQSINQSDDQELESQKLLWFDRDQLTDRLMNGEFKEAKWSATIAMAIIWMNRNHSTAGIVT